MSERAGGSGVASPPTFVGFEDPLCGAAKAILAVARIERGEADLGAVTVVVPGGRARRQLLRALVVEAGGRGLRLAPPRTILPDAVELTVRDAPVAPLATDVTVWLAWAEALRVAPEDDRARLAPAGLADLGQRLRLAARLRDAHREVEAGCIDLRDVARRAEEGGADGARYLALARVASRARGLIAEHGLVDEDAARALALERPLRDGGPVFLLGVVDPTTRLLRALDGLGERLRVLCLAPASMADRFDAAGAVRPDAWLRCPPEVPLDRIAVADGPLDQAEAAFAQLARSAEDGVVDPDRCAIVLADQELAGAVARELVARGVGVHDALGRGVARLPAGRLLARLAEHLREPTTRTLRALLHEPAADAALAARSGIDGGAVLPHLDRWLTEHHDRTLDVGVFGDEGELPRLDAALRALAAEFDGLRPLGAFARPLLAFLGQLFGAPTADDRGLGDAAVVAIRDTLSALGAAPVALQPRVDAPEAIEALLSALAPARVREEPRADELDLVGWLELPFDPATDVVVVGMNEGCVPASSADPLLPDALRRALGLPDDRRRAARDAYLLAIALARRSARFVLGRRRVAGDPLAPSRLLLTGRGAGLARRIEALTEAPPYRVPGRPTQRHFAAPAAPSGRVELARVRVTAFRRYLDSPYHFWLEQLLGLRCPEPAGDEMDALAFGNVVHATLEAFGRRSDAPALADPERIHRYLVDDLERVLDERAGRAPGAGLRIQRRILHDRLRWFAERQATEVRAGWRIRAVEIPLAEAFDVPDDDPVTLVGKVDRVDYHEAGRRWRILDYKTADDAKKPDAAHLSSAGVWRDLQLPLYHHLLAARLQAEAPGDVELGYFNLGPTSAQVGVALAEKLTARIPMAVERAREIVRAVRAGAFELPRAGAKFESEAVAILCRTPALADEDEEDDA